MNKIFVLCVDGGGIRGIAPVQFLKRLEDHLKKSLYDTFEMYSGTSTGSFIIASIAYKKMTADYIMTNLYNKKNINRIMNKSFIDKCVGTVQLRPKYDGVGKTQVISETVGELFMKSTEKKVIVPGFDVSKSKPTFFKSYNINGNSKNDIKVKDALDISSAAPSYFPTCYSKERNLYGIDGGVFANNPTACCYADALRLFGKDSDINVLSIGTGYSGEKKHNGKRTKKFGGIQWITEGNLMEIVYDGPQSAVDYEMKNLTEALNHKYLRIDGSLENTCMDDTSEKNIQVLKDAGDSWWEEYKEKVLEFLISNLLK
jgi:patatin-like phospholipase/acyl hydrolase